jgi:hypothetical protein
MNGDFTGWHYSYSHRKLNSILNSQRRARKKLRKQEPQRSAQSLDSASYKGRIGYGHYRWSLRPAPA